MRGGVTEGKDSETIGGSLHQPEVAESMDIVERGRVFLQGLRALAGRPAWEWRRCPRCGETETCKWGSYRRRPWFLSGRQTVRVQRHRCRGCKRTYSEGSALLVRGGWYAREVKRSAIDHWRHLGSSIRRTAEVLRSWLGQQERWQVWRPLAGRGTNRHGLVWRLREVRR